MNNLSIDSQPIKLRAREKYIVIDPLYLDDIRENLTLLDKNNLLLEIKEKVFLYTDNPFIEYVPLSEYFNINLISKVNDFDTIKGNDVVCTDSGMIIFINERVFLSLISRFSYGELTDSLTEIINQTYWKELMSIYDPYNLGLIIAPGLGLEFDGSGVYRIGL